MKSARTYQREIKYLRELVISLQWVQPMYNGNPSCSGCGEQQHLGCSKDCEVAKLSGDYGGYENG